MENGRQIFVEAAGNHDFPRAMKRVVLIEYSALAKKPFCPHDCQVIGLSSTAKDILSEPDIQKSDHTFPYQLPITMFFVKSYILESDLSAIRLLVTKP